MAYKITLNADELKTLYWLSARGYFPELLLDEMTLADDTADDQTKGDLEYNIPEFAAWSLFELREEDPDAYLACLGGDLLNKVLTLESEIV